MPTLGPIPSEIAIISDYPDRSDFNIRAATEKLSRLGIVATSCFITSILETAPPIIDGSPDIDEWISKRKTCPAPGWSKRGDKWVHQNLVAGLERIQRYLGEVKPKLVITLGKAPLLMLTGYDSVNDWGGSRISQPGYPYTILPTFHPRDLVKQPANRFILEMDLTRAYNIYTGKQIPRIYDFVLKPTMAQATGYLLSLLSRADQGPIKISGDIETRAGHIACMGLAGSPTSAICIPHLIVRPEGSTESPFYWHEEDEAIIIGLYHQLFAHPNILWIGQNFTYDCQYFWRHWGCVPSRVRDTMVGHHSLHSNIKKGLAFLSRMYAQDHVYWKDEINDWDPLKGEMQFWEYNAKDCCITYEIWDEIEKERNRE